MTASLTSRARTRCSPIRTPRRKQVVDLARTYLGTPFRHQGRDRFGLDCVGLALRVGNDLGLVNYDIKTYSPRTNGHEFMSYFRQAGLIEVQWKDRQIGDIILMHDQYFPCHTAFLTQRGHDRIIHAFALRRKVVEEAFTEHWRKKLVGVFSFKE